MSGIGGTQAGGLEAERGDQGNGVLPAGADARRRAREAGGGVRDEADGLVSDLREEGAEVLGAARDRASDMVEERKERGASMVEQTARAVRGAAAEFEEREPRIARYVGEAASGLDDLAKALREQSAGDLLGRAEELARRQPAAFFGATMLAGFALARFARASAERRGADHDRDAHRRYADRAGLRPSHAQDTGPSSQSHGGGTPPTQGDATAHGPSATATTAATLGGAAARSQQAAQPRVEPGERRA